MAWSKNYTISTDVTSGSVRSHELTDEINTAIASAVCQDCEVSGDTLTVNYDVEPSAGDKTTADTTVQDHVPSTRTKAHTGSYVPLINPDANGEVAVTQDATWQEISIHDGNPGYYIPVLATSLGRYTVKVKCNATGGTPEVKVIERDADGSNPVDITATPIAVSDTAGVWSALQFNTNVVPRSGLHEFCVAARLNGGTSLSVKGSIAIALLELL